MFWRSTPRECKALLGEIAAAKEDAARASFMRTASIMAELRNTRRTRSGDKVWTWRDFVKEPTQEITPDEQFAMLAEWAERHNRRVEA